MNRKPSQRRTVLRSAVTGGVVTVALLPDRAAAAPWRPSMVRADALRAGDMVGAVDGRVLRVDGVERRGRRVRVQYADDRLLASSPGGQLLARSRPVLVYARDVPVRALADRLPPSAPSTVDGGRP